MAAQVNTVSGPLSADKLGKTLIHEHIIFGYPGWYGDMTMAPFDRKAVVKEAVAVLKEIKELGVTTFVDATPNECGRDPELLKEVSEKSGINIICSTGYYFEAEGAPAYFKFRSQLLDAGSEIYEMFMKEITEGIGTTGIKAGVIKLASSENCITDYEKMFFLSAARAHKETGIPIITHTQHGSMGPEQAEFLVSEGVDPKKIMIGHMSDNTDIRYHLNTLKHGVFISFDRMGIQVIAGCPYDSEKYPVLIGLIGGGYADRIMISHDYVIHWLGRPIDIPEEISKPLIGNWYPTHLFKNIIPELKKGGITDEQINSVVVDNPRVLFGG